MGENINENLIYMQYDILEGYIEQLKSVENYEIYLVGEEIAKINSAMVFKNFLKKLIEEDKVKTKTDETINKLIERTTEYTDYIDMLLLTLEDRKNERNKIENLQSEINKLLLNTYLPKEYENKVRALLFKAKTITKVDNTYYSLYNLYTKYKEEAIQSRDKIDPIVPKKEVKVPEVYSGGDNMMYRGDSLNALIHMLYLSYRHTDDCVVIPVEEYSNVTSKSKHSDLMIVWDEKERRFVYPENYWSYFERCKGKRYIIFPFGISCENNFKHANFMVYDTYLNTIERFEPHGYDETFGRCTENLDENIENLLRDNLDGDFMYFSPYDYCPNLGFQRIQIRENKTVESDPAGFCQAWSAWYADLRLLNPDVDRKTLSYLAIEKLKEDDRSFTEYIRNYANFTELLRKDFLESRDPVKTFKEFAKKFTEN